MQFQSTFFSIIIPAKNEADNVDPLVNEILTHLTPKHQFEIIYVDDGSTDLTSQKVLALIQLHPDIIRLIQHEHSAGQSTAILTGVSQASGELIVTIDADGQNDPGDIINLLSIAETFPKTSHFCIAGFRKHRKDTAWKRFQSRVANKVRSKLLGDDTPDTGCGLKVVPRRTFLKLPYFDHMHRYLPALIKRLGGTIKIVEVKHRDRQHGESKYGMWGRLLAGLVDMLGVIWLQKRNKIPTIKECFPDE
ncbi:glycosyltransferase family 2 protein [Glaciecola sp. 33A]|jgi:glycosyltransferase involved in cell wall biosynthesis|uniref:glycosyltransferase family 2 protein n=1 Tax=Glaciecola sp. 33A TaxID=2057807 RepID=UPI000C32F0F2|nr:glycosyltransferase family 2 protein [Glaciecola sp. 33A]PKI00215.1 dolichol-phosphate mannosyltransferase [Glaciecola sp. 33A]